MISLPGTQDASRLEVAALCSLLGLVAVLQISIAASGILLTTTLGLWAALLVNRRERPSAPAFFLPLGLYAFVTLVSVAFSLDPLSSLIDSREVLLFLVVPVVYRLARGVRAQTVATIIVTVGGASAVFGVVQFGILEFDNLGQRPSGTMGHYMTYSGLLVLVVALAGARVLYDRGERVWSGLVMPALLVALALTLTRSYMVGAAAARMLRLYRKGKLGRVPLDRVHEHVQRRVHIPQVPLETLEPHPVSDPQIGHLALQLGPGFTLTREQQLHVWNVFSGLQSRERVHRQGVVLDRRHPSQHADHQGRVEPKPASDLALVGQSGRLVHGDAVTHHARLLGGNNPEIDDDLVALRLAGEQHQ